MKLLFVFCFLIAAHFSFAQKNTPPKKSGWTAVYAHDENGARTAGDMTELLNGLRKGYSVKIGWSWTRTIADSTVTLEHFAEPIFVTIIQQKKCFCHS